MLLKIDDSLIEYLKENLSNPDIMSEEIQALNNLSLAHRDQKHILIGTMDAVEYLKSFKSLDETAQRIYSNLYSKYSFMGAYEDIFNSKVLIKSRDFEISKTKSEGKTVYQVPITYFFDIESINKTALIGEDRSDCRFYEGLAKKYVKETYRSTGFNLSFHHENGGGDTTWTSLQYYSENNKISITVADSDKRYPKSNVGNTLKKLRTEYKKHENISVTELVELGVREKENLIPPSLYLYCCNGSDRSNLKKLTLLEEADEHHEKLFYLDLKEGLTVKNYKRDIELQSFIKDLLEEFPELLNNKMEDLESLPDEHKIIEGVSSNISDFFCNGFFYEGLDKELEKKLALPDVPEEVINELKLSVEVKNKMFEYLPAKFRNNIDDLCEKLVDWGCSNNTFIST